MKHAFYSRQHHSDVIKNGGGIMALNEYGVDKVFHIRINVFQVVCEGKTVIATHLLWDESISSIPRDAVCLGKIDEAAGIIDLDALSVPLQDLSRVCPHGE